MAELLEVLVENIIMCGAGILVIAWCQWLQQRQDKLMLHLDHAQSLLEGELALHKRLVTQCCGVIARRSDLPENLRMSLIRDIEEAIG